MTWNSGIMSDNFNGLTVKEAEALEEQQEREEEQHLSDMDKVYRERNRMVAHLAAEYPSTFIPGADPECPTWAVVFVDLPTGQTSWHIGPRDFDLFSFIPHVIPGQVEWDGHTTEEKYDRLDKYTRMVYTARMATGRSGSIEVHPNGETFVEIDEDFYVLGDKVMCRLEHKEPGQNIVGNRSENDPSAKKLEAMLSEHDRVHHEGP